MIKPDQKLLHKKKGYKFIVYKQEGNVVRIHRYGGGREYRVPEEIVKVDFHLVDEFVTELQDDVAFIQDWKRFSCKADRYDRWNGWAKPLFTKKIAERVLEEFSEYNSEFAEQLEVVDEEDGLYSVGAGSLMWELESDYDV